MSWIDTFCGDYATVMTVLRNLVNEMLINVYTCQAVIESWSAIEHLYLFKHLEWHFEWFLHSIYYIVLTFVQLCVYQKK